MGDIVKVHLESYTKSWMTVNCWAKWGLVVMTHPWRHDIADWKSHCKKWIENNIKKARGTFLAEEVKYSMVLWTTCPLEVPRNVVCFQFFFTMLNLGFSTCLFWQSYSTIVPIALYNIMEVRHLPLLFLWWSGTVHLVHLSAANHCGIQIHYVARSINPLI